MKDWGMKDWIMELCPEIADWQAEMIAEAAHNQVLDEREACAALCFQIWNKWLDEKDTTPFPDAEDCAFAIRARGQG
jgi:hypothetical protein